MRGRALARLVVIVCVACMLGGADRKTLFMVAAEWRGMEKIAEVAAARAGQVLVLDAPAVGVGWP